MFNATLVVPHPLNWLAGWWFILLAFLVGAIIGLGFHRPDFLGGYNSLRRRMLRLGHIALAALGMMNVLYGLSPVFAPAEAGVVAAIASRGLIAGALAMPIVCFLTAWKSTMRHLFFIPVATLLAAVIAIVVGGVS